jgi:glycerate kinase
LKPKDIREVEKIEIDNEEKRSLLEDLEIIMPCDVQNAMLGPKGAAYVFGP